MEGFRRLMQRFLRALGGAVYDHPWTFTACGGALLLVASWLSIFHLGVINNINDLIRPDSPVHKFYLDYKKEFGVREEMIVVIRSDDFERNRAVADDLGSVFAQRPQDFERIYYRHDFSRLEKKLLFFETPEELEAIAAELKNLQGILRRTGNKFNLNTMLDEAIAGFDESRLRKSENLAAFGRETQAFIERLNRLADELEGTPASTAPVAERATPARDLDAMRRQLELNRYLTFDQGRILLMLLTPTEGDASSFSPYGATIERLRRDIREARLRHPGVDIGLTGEPVLLDDEMKQSTQDSIIAGIVTFVLISLLFFYSYHEIVRPALALGVLVVVIAWSMGLTVLLVGHLNVISQACVIMIMGLGIDFGIQITGRYEEELARGRGVREAVIRTLENTGLAVLTGGSTTAAAFFTMCFNDFIGLAELGIISGAGMVAAVVANLALLPALLVLRDRPREAAIAAAPPRIHAFRADIDRVLFSRPRLALTGFALLAVLAAFGLPRIRYDYNLLNLQNPRMESVQYEKALLNSPSSTAMFGVIVANNIEDARIKSEQLRQLPVVRGVRSLDQALPPDQEAKLPALRQIAQTVRTLRVNTDVSAQINVAKARRDLRRLLDMAREAEREARKYKAAASLAGRGRLVDQAIEIFSRMIPPLERAVATFDRLSQEEIGRRLTRYQAEAFGRMAEEIEWLRSQNLLEPITLDDLPEEIRTRYLSPSGKVLIEIDPVENLWEEEPNKRFVEQVRTVDPAATGTPVQNYQYINLLRDSYVDAAGYAFLAILVLVYLHFLSVKKLLLTLLPLGLGVLYTFGLMGWAGIQFNPANIITLPLVIGIGIAFGVYVVDRHDEEGRVALAGSSTGKALLLSALTTITGFASMTLGEYRGLISLGLVMSIGVALCFLSAALILPQILVLLDQRKAKNCEAAAS
jgi:hopanoid biosynthesis associated RND transporter like protein HpnN